jgi:hypothetical protein
MQELPASYSYFTKIGLDESTYSTGTGTVCSSERGTLAYITLLVAHHVVVCQ